MKKLAIIFTLVFVSIWSVPASYADFQTGLDAYERGEFTLALEEWTPLAEQGDVDAQNYLADMYDKGQGVPPDDHSVFYD